MSREIFDYLKRERDMCIQTIIPSKNTALMLTPALTGHLLVVPMRVLLLSSPLLNGHPEFNARKLTLFWKRRWQKRLWSKRWQLIKTFKHTFIMIVLNFRNWPDGENIQAEQTPIKRPPPISSRVAANSGSTGCSDSLINAMEIYVLGLISMDVYICLPKPRGVQSKPFLGIDLLCSQNAVHNLGGPVVSRVTSFETSSSNVCFFFEFAILHYALRLSRTSWFS